MARLLHFIKGGSQEFVYILIEEDEKVDEVVAEYTDSGYELSTDAYIGDDDQFTGMPTGRRLS